MPPNEASLEFTYSPEMERLLARSALINHYYEDEFDISFSSLFLAFLVNDDPISRWFQNCIKRAEIDVQSIMKERNLNQQIMEEIARAVPSVSRSSYKLTTSAQRYLQAAGQFCQMLSGTDTARPLDVHHLMAVFIYRPWVHERDLIRWGLNKRDWSNAFLEQMRSLRPEELDFWEGQHRRTFNIEP